MNITSREDRTHRYGCYGVVLETNRPFEEVDPPYDEADLDVVRVDFLRPEDSPYALTHRVRSHFTAGHVTLEMTGTARFDIPSADHIVATVYPDAEDQLMGLPLLGPVMATRMHRCGNFVLHGSAFFVNNGVTALVGDRGAGKSTTAGALVAEGLTFYTDDIVAVDVDGGKAEVAAGYPLTKLSPEAAAAFFGPDIRTLSAGRSGYPKIRVLLTRATVPRTAPLKNVLVLKRGLEPALEKVSSDDAFGLLLRYAYMVKYGETAFAGSRSADHFRHCVTLAKSVNLGILTVPEGLDRIAEVRSLVEAGME